MRPFFSDVGFRLLFGIVLAFAFSLPRAVEAQEDPYFVTDHYHLPDTGALGIATYAVAGVPKGGNGFLGSEMEFEYRATKWWGTSIVLHGQSTLGESTLFTGYSWENKFKLAPAGTFFLNPVLVFKWEDLSGADKSVAEIEGHASTEDFTTPNAVAHQTREHEVEMKLILSRDYRAWNFSGNMVAAKEWSDEPWQFGYSLGVSRPLSAREKDKGCNLCSRAFSAGMEFYGGLGDAHQFGLSNTSHYLGPAISWELANGVAFKAAPNFGLTRESQHAFVHFAMIYDIPDFKDHVRKWFH